MSLNRTRVIAAAVAVALLLLVVSVSLASAAASRKAAKIEFIFNQPYKTTAEDFTGKVRVKSGRKYKKPKVVVTLHRYSLTDENREGRILFRRTIRLDELKAGLWEREVRYQPRDVRREGSYPLRVQLVQGKKVIAEDHRRLLIYRKTRRIPMDLVLVIDTSQKSIIDAKGKLLDDRKEQYAANLRGILDAAASAPSASFSLNYTPAFLAQLETVKAAETQKEARALREGLKSAHREGRVDLALSPSAGGDLAQLSVMGWRSEISGQVKQGQFNRGGLVGESSIKPVLLPPGLSMDRSAIKDLAATGVKTVLWDGGDFGSYAPKGPLVLHDAEGSEIQALVADKLIQQELSSVDAAFNGDLIGERALQEFLKKRSTRKRLMVAVVSGDGLDQKAVSRMLRNISSMPWLNTMTFRGALDEYEADVYRLAPNSTPQSGYYKRLDGVRRRLINFVKVSKKPKTWQDQAWGKLRLASMYLWRTKGQNEGLSFMDTVNDEIKRELGLLSMDVTSVTLTGQNGKIPVQVRSARDESTEITVKAQGSGLDFPKGREFKMVLEKGENLIAVPVSLGDAAAEAVVELWAGDERISQQTTPIKGVSSRVWIILIGGLAVAVFLLSKVFKLARGWLTP